MDLGSAPCHTSCELDILVLHGVNRGGVVSGEEASVDVDRGRARERLVGARSSKICELLRDVHFM